MSEQSPNGGFERLDVYRLSERVADEIWKTVSVWDWFAKDTVGKQLVKAADSIGANTAEGSGRFHYQDNRRFVRIARGSLYETRHWLRRAYRRGLLPKETVDVLSPVMSELGPRLNAYLRSIGTSSLREDPRLDNEIADDPPAEDWVFTLADEGQETNDQ